MSSFKETRALLKKATEAIAAAYVMLDKEEGEATARPVEVRLRQAVYEKQFGDVLKSIEFGASKEIKITEEMTPSGAKNAVYRYFLEHMKDSRASISGGRSAGDPIHVTRLRAEVK
jgi:hypothetical protein